MNQNQPMRFKRCFVTTTVALHLALITGLILSGGSMLSLLGALILFAPLPGMLRADGTTYRWATLLLSFYVAFLLAEGYARPLEQTAWFALAALAAADFMGLIACSRFTSRATASQTAG